MSRFLRLIDNINGWVGRVVSFFVLAIIAIIMYEVVMRYVLVKPQLWVSETSVFLFGALFMLGGGYALLNQGHVKLDAVYERFSLRVRAILDLVTFIFFLIFCGVLIWKGWLVAWESLLDRETTAGAFAPPLYPIKLTIPVGTGLLLLQGIAKFIRDISIATMRNKVER